MTLKYCLAGAAVAAATLTAAPAAVPSALEGGQAFNVAWRSAT